ncbi:MAG: PBP1A family penicillin-binding protein [Bacteroidia bacterium]|nr:PBP1A family penicillin-binding protein [Bacteroidia bacterium]MDW8235734.1 PBP1A family penicillin-binding protein [Bacteroidia bacterium]MDW8417612.1 PBP1A family penicillin-binding protein [Bacteroidia bacterium]
MWELNPEYKRERLLLALSIIGIFWGIPLLLFLYVFLEMPSFKRLENPAQDLASVAYSADGKILGTFYLTTDRVRIPANEIPPIVKKALIAVEDRRFYEHNGIDPMGIIGALFSSAIGKRRGGSTITQQLARNLYDEVGIERTLWRKLKEMIVAIYLEYRYGKEEILTMYLNTVPFGGVTYGIQAASRYYFGKNAKELTLPEAALLIGLLRGPTYYSPYKHPQRALARRNLVLELMEEAGFISQKELQAARKAPLGVGSAPYTASQSSGLAPYFREHLRQWLLRWARQKGYDLYRDGLQIYTTIDSRLQAHAESAVVAHMSSFQKIFEKELNTQPSPWEEDSLLLPRAIRRSERYLAARNAGLSEEEIHKQFHRRVPMRVFTWEPPGYKDTIMTPLDSIIYYLRFLEAGLVSIDPHTGEIKAWVGGINHTFFKYDHVVQSKRQVGSTFKPFVYTAAMDNGYSPCYEELNVPVEIPVQVDGRDTVWSPRNADREIGGKVSLKQALALSLNIITARLIRALGPQVVIQYARQMGIQSELEPVYALGLGVCDLNVLELTSAYGCFPTLGIWREPIFVREIRDRRGNIIETFTAASRRALSEKTAYLMVEMLRWVVIAGTAGELKWRFGLYDLDIGGKTGTTQQHADGWFVGFTPDLVTGIWVGTADRAVHFSSLVYGQGARMALPIWGIYMKAAYQNKSLGFKKRAIKPPPGFVPPICEPSASPEESIPTALEEYFK